MPLLHPPADPAVVLERAYRALARGEPATAEGMLAGLSELPAPLGRIARLVEAQAALSRGSLDLALARVERALPPRPPEAWERAELTSALGVRAVLRALSGNPEGARRDIARVQRELPEPSALALARAALAEAIVLARMGDRARLRTLVEHHGRHMARLPLPHESALAAAYARMAGSGQRSVYRQPGGAEGAAPSRGLLRWIGQVAPEAAPFVDAAAFEKRLAEARKAKLVADEAQPEPEGDDGRPVLVDDARGARAVRWSLFALLAVGASTALSMFFFRTNLLVGLGGAALVALVAVGIALRVVSGSKPAPATPWLSEREALLRALVLRRLGPPEAGPPRRRARIAAPRLRIARRAVAPQDEGSRGAAEDEALSAEEAVNASARRRARGR
ncbi:hypothetical protein [Polyangium aurulentum]|uniref:hypothetical protein n=1 Tax=Polyangium aurulentum TaxID=2567896 RepID=UPI0010ADEDFE|nr:hypothetical protein [Polyangium aurulentum]UQA57321.1 hypothetical protein E8A73_039490 [Polyangium aurulentum]